MTRSFSGAVALASSLMLLTVGKALADREHGVAPGRHVLEGPEVSIYNIAGEMHVAEGTGRSVVVEVTPGGRDGGRLTVEETTEKGHPVLRVNYPEDHIVYREFGFGPPDGVSSSSLDYDGRRIYVSGRGSGMEAHADIRVLVPRGKTVHLHLAVGRGFIAGVDGDLSFKGASSSVQVERATGALAIDIGSGNIQVSRSQARIAAQTGSGNISISEVDGDLAADAGSGNIDLKRVGAEKISLDAGSGAINGSDIRVSSMSADCGSGEIDLDGTSAGKLSLEAGSGSIHLRLAKNIDELAIEAGSGSVRLEAPESLSARFRIECPKRNLHIGFPFESERNEDDMTVGTIGSGHGSIHIEAGSGSVDLARM
jgi:DUF4097 and DUF4098 domain-containing protein YvlB